MSIKKKLLVLTMIPVFFVTLLGAATALWITVSENEALSRRDLTSNLEQLKKELDQLAADARATLDATIENKELSATARSLYLLGSDTPDLMRNLQCQMMQQLRKHIQATGYDLVAFLGPEGLYGYATPALYAVSAVEPETGRPLCLVPTADSALVDCSAKRWKEAALPSGLPRGEIASDPTTRFVTLDGTLYVESIAPIKLLIFSSDSFEEKAKTIGAFLLRKKVSEEFLATFSRKVHKDAYIFLPSGALCAGSSPFEAERCRELIQRSVAGGPLLTDYRTASDRYDLMLSPYRYGNDTVAVLVSHTSREVVEEEIRRIIILQLGGLVAGLLIATAIALVTGKLITGPIGLISNQMKEIASSKDLDRKVTVTSRDELGVLASSFNDMTTELKSAHGSLEAYKEHLEELVEQRTQELRDSLEKLESANGRIVESIQYARTIQQAILPPRASIVEHLADHFVIWNPKDVIGGDIFWMDGHAEGFLVAVIDCTGHGVPGAVMTMISCATLDRVVHEQGFKDPAAILAELNRLVRNTLSNHCGHRLSDDGLDIGICYVNGSRTSMTFAGARISLFFTKEGEVHEIKGDRHSVGYRSSDPDYPFRNHSVEVDASMRFYMATDGVHDQVGGEKSLPFGKRRFRELIAGLHERPFSEQRELFLRALMDYKGDDAQRDDITVLGFSV